MVAYWVCVSTERSSSSSKQGFVQILPKKPQAASTFCQWPLGKALPGVTGAPTHPDFKRLYLRGWHSSPRQCHTPARPGGLHMYTLSNHPSVTWVTSRSCCSAGGLCIGSDWWKGRKQKERKQRNMVHVHVGNEFMCTDDTTAAWEEWWGVCICSLVTSFSTPLQMSLLSASANLTRSTTRDGKNVEFKELFWMKGEWNSLKAKRLVKNGKGWCEQRKWDQQCQLVNYLHFLFFPISPHNSHYSPKVSDFLIKFQNAPTMQ